MPGGVQVGMPGGVQVGMRVGVLPVGVRVGVQVGVPRVLVYMPLGVLVGVGVPVGMPVGVDLVAGAGAADQGRLDRASFGVTAPVRGIHRNPPRVIRGEQFYSARPYSLWLVCWSASEIPPPRLVTSGKAGGSGTVQRIKQEMKGPFVDAVA
jgi:hypothetical protein